jgi:HEAT repeat protein
MYSKEAYPLLLATLQHENHFVRGTAVDELDNLGATETEPEIRKLANDSDEDIRNLVAIVLENFRDELNECRHDDDR